MNKLLISAAIVGIATISGAESANAYGTGTLKCYGVATAGQNDCAAFDGSHSCAGKAAASYNANDWIYTETEEQCWEMCGHIGTPTAPIPAGHCDNGAAPENSGANDMKIMPSTMSTTAAPATAAAIPANAKVIKRSFVGDRDNQGQ